MNNRKQLAELIQAWADNPDSYFEIKGEKIRYIPGGESNLNEWELVIPPKEHPMQKYIYLNLDMEFSDSEGFTSKCFDNLTHILDKTYNYKSPLNGNFKHCRLRPNHVHWWGSKSDINPIPEGCEYRIYINDGWGAWVEYAYSLTIPWENILAFEIRYLK